ncbi:MAG: ABC transporter permease subunit [Lentisphaerae bacterium]|nr:ABC transporter permease subunit [Lentisphaerota bacterium]
MLTKTERKSRTGRLFLAGVFAAILVGSVTMVYPFILMLSGSLRSDMDINQMDIVPDYLTDTRVLVRKFLETKYNYDPAAMNIYRQGRDYSFELASVPATVHARRVDDFKAFVRETETPDHWHILGGLRTIRNMRSVVLDVFSERVKAHYHGDVDAFNRDIGGVIRTWGQVDMIGPNWVNPRYDYTPSATFDIYTELVRERPLAERAMVNITGEFLQEVIYPAYGMDGVEDYNAAHARPVTSYDVFALPRRLPGRDRPALREEWLTFVREHCHVSFIRAAVPEADYQAFVREYFGRDIARLQRHWPARNLSRFEDVRLPGEREWLFAAQATVYRRFLESVDPSALYLVGPEFAWQDWLRGRYGDVDALNRAHGTDYAALDAVRMPIAETEARYVQRHSGMLRRRYALRNYRIVAQQIFVQGRPFYNTIVYVGLTLILALTVQPLAAYALSRFNPPGMWKFIFIFMATMAFPPMVSTIPQFLLIKKLNLLNTFIALVIPVAINGYLVFLLKGFFDSIPQHLYEAATIDGASELTMFWRITMALSKPILAVVALNAFRLAWMSFMHPLIVCPDEKMHVLAVWLHQFQQSAPASAVFASILMASIPTLLIFIVTQGTIMKGIAVPAEK